MIGRDTGVGPHESGFDSLRWFVGELHRSLQQIDGKRFMRLRRDPTTEPRVRVGVRTGVNVGIGVNTGRRSATAAS